MKGGLEKSIFIFLFAYHLGHYCFTTAISVSLKENVLLRDNVPVPMIYPLPGRRKVNSRGASNLNKINFSAFLVAKRLDQEKFLEFMMV